MPPPGSSESTDEWTPPQRFDGFEVERPLGRGGMGHVYLAHETMLDRHVALKFIAAVDPAPAARDRFLREARALARMQHPNVVGVFRLSEYRGRPYLVYEFVAGLSLDRLAKPMAWPRVLPIAAGMASGLAAAHQRGVLHRDIKPSNVLIGHDGEVKLIDFGLAKLARTSNPAGERREPRDGATTEVPGIERDPTLSSAGSAATLPAVALANEATAAGLILGTPLYLAPELWRGEAATEQTDLFALGLVIYELLAGSLPFASLRGAELAHAVANQDLPPLRALRPETPHALGDIVDRAVRRRPEERLRTVEELRQGLDAFAAVYHGFATDDANALPERDAVRVTASFARLSLRTDDLAAAFYDRLFAANPHLRPLFPADISGLRIKLVGVLRSVVANLRQPTLVTPLLEDLGRRHAGYGAEAGHFDLAGEALLSALASLEGSVWDDDLARAWSGAYALLSGVMQRGLEAEQPTPDPGSVTAG